MELERIQLREADLKDLQTLKLIEQEVIKYERPYAPNLKDDPITYYDLEDLIKRKDAQVLVAVIDNEIVGSGYAQIENSVVYKKPEKYVYLGFMYVAPNYRGKGINGKLTKRLIAWANRQNISEIQLDVYADNTSAINAYSKVGFRPDLLKMRLNTDKK